MKLQPVVFDASTLILLAKSDLLSAVASRVEILIPRVVREEALAKPDLYDAKIIARMLIEGTIRLAGKLPPHEVKSLLAQFRLGEGEAAALLASRKQKCPLGIDDGPGIRAAKILGVPFMTAIQALVGLSLEGHLGKNIALAKLENLALCGRYSAQIIGDARQKIMESR